MTGSPHLVLALLLLGSLLLPLCTAVKMEDFKVRSWGPALRIKVVLVNVKCRGCIPTTAPDLCTGSASCSQSIHTLLEHYAKEYEMVCALQKCTDAAFCNRLLGTVDEDYCVEPASVSIAGSQLVCKVKNKAKPDVDLTLTLTAYGGFVRLHINEDPSNARFEVPHVLHKDLAQSQSSWDKSKRAAGQAQLKLGDADITLKYSPLQLTVDIMGKPAMVFNSRQMFNFEHRRQKKVGCCLLPRQRLCHTKALDSESHLQSALLHAWQSP